MAVHDFGPHGEKSRVIWHSGTVQPFSSLWIILQRFLLLNRPTQSAFTHDFFEKKSIQHFGKISLNSNGTNREAPPLRLVRLARVLHESPKRFERSLIGQYPHTLWPLFREFAICPSCLKEGFHSVLFSLDGLTHCPIHLDKLTPYACCEKKKFIHSLQNIDFSTPGQCECGKRFLGYREAREPATNLGRDEALADVTQWLELIGSRCFLGLRHYLSSDSQIDRFTQHVSRLTEPLQLSAPPQWWPPNFNLPHAFLPKMTFHVYGGMAQRSGSSKLDSLHRRFYTPHKTQNPYTYQKIIEADFKSIKRYLMHHAVQNCRKWISKFASASDATRIVDMLNNGGDDARNAWAILIWWQSSVWTLNLRDMTRKNSLKVLFDSDIPVLQYQDSNDPYFTLQLQGAQEWVMRWLNATSLITQWCAAKAEAFCAWSPYDLVWGRGVLGMRPVPSWSAGLNDQQRMLLYVDRPLGFRWAKNNRPTKAERQTQFLEQAGVRFDVLRTVSLQSCRWYHGVNMEWDSAPGPIPMEVKDCKRHHMTFEGKRYLFLVFPWLQTNDERRSFVARCLDIPLAATGQSPKEAIYSLKFAIHRYCILIAKTA